MSKCFHSIELKINKKISYENLESYIKLLSSCQIIFNSFSSIFEANYVKYILCVSILYVNKEYPPYVNTVQGNKKKGIIKYRKI